MADQYDIQIAQLKAEKERLGIYKTRLEKQERQETEAVLTAGKLDISTDIAMLAKAGLILPGMVDLTTITASHTGQQVQVGDVNNAYSLSDLLDYTTDVFSQDIENIQAQYIAEFTDINAQMGNLQTQISKTKQAQQTAQQKETVSGWTKIGLGVLEGGVGIATLNPVAIVAGVGSVVSGILDFIF